MAVFGLFFMDQWMQQSDGGCIASTMQGAGCPMNGFGLLVHHMAAYKTFFTVLVPGIVAVFLLVFLSVFIFRLALKKELDLHPDPLFRFWQRWKDGRDKHHQQKLIHWLAIFEHSPAL